MSGTSDMIPTQEPALRPKRKHGVRKLRFEVELEFDGRIPLPDGLILTAIADAFPLIDEQGMLFPGVVSPRHLERLLDWSVILVGAGRRIRPSALDQMVEKRRRDGDVGLRAFHGGGPNADGVPQQVAEEVLAAIDDTEPQLLELAMTAWQAIGRLRYAAARLAEVDSSDLDLAIAEGREALTTAQSILVRPGTGDADPN